MKEGVDYELSEYKEDQWSILVDGIEFIIDEILFDEDDKSLDNMNAKIKYTVISDKKPKDVSIFDDLVGEIVCDILENMSNNTDKDKDEK